MTIPEQNQEMIDLVRRWQREPCIGPPPEVEPFRLREPPKPRRRGQDFGVAFAWLSVWVVWIVDGGSFWVWCFVMCGMCVGAYCEARRSNGLRGVS